MKKSIRNLVIGAVMAITTLAASTAAFAAQYVQNDMNFRSGASITSTIIGSVPAGAQVEVLGTQSDWNLIRYNGVTGYIHAGNIADTYTAKQAKQNTMNGTTQQGSNTTQSYFDNNWTQTATNMNNNAGTWKTVSVASGYLALRKAPTYDYNNEIGQLHNGDTVQLAGGSTSGSYVQVYSPKFGCYGWVNAGFLA